MSQAESARHDDADGLELSEDITFQRREWTVQRIGWVLMLLLVIAAAAGLVGSGPISTTAVGEQGGALYVEYQRFGRLQAPEEMRLHLGQPTDGKAEIWISSEYLQRMNLEQITPEPESARAEPDRQVFVFEVGAGQGDATVTFALRPTQPGLGRGQLGIKGGPTVNFRQFVYP